MNLGDLLLIHACATLSMVGVIWFVQVVHYPLFPAVGSDSFASYELENQRRTSWVVVPLMITELLSAVTLLYFDLNPPNQLAARIGAALLAVIWASTFLLQVPLHRALGAGFDLKHARRLVRSNWIRTIAWSVRGLIALLLLKA